MAAPALDESDDDGFDAKTLSCMPMQSGSGPSELDEGGVTFDAMAVEAVAEPTPVKSTLTGMIGRARQAVFGERAAKKEDAGIAPPSTMTRKPMPAPADMSDKATAPSLQQTPTTADLSAFAERLRVVVSSLTSRREAGIDDAVEELRLIAEEAAHAGVPPAKRKVIDDAVALLLQRDVDGAVRLLQLIVDAAPTTRRSGSFWG